MARTIWRTPWQPGPAADLPAGPAGPRPLLVSVTEFRTRRPWQIGPVTIAGVLLRRSWPRTPGAVGMWLWLDPDPLRPRSGSVSLWHGTAGLNAFVARADHRRIVRAYRGKGEMRSASWGVGDAGSGGGAGVRGPGAASGPPTWDAGPASGPPVWGGGLTSGPPAWDAGPASGHGTSGTGISGARAGAGGCPVGGASGAGFAPTPPGGPDSGSAAPQGTPDAPPPDGAPPGPGPDADLDATAPDRRHHRHHHPRPGAPPAGTGLPPEDIWEAARRLLTGEDPWPSG